MLYQGQVIWDPLWICLSRKIITCSRCVKVSFENYSELVQELFDKETMNVQVLFAFLICENYQKKSNAT